MEVVAGVRRRRQLNTSNECGGPRAGVVHDVVVYADPRRPPYSLRPLTSALAATTRVCRRVHCHSSVKEISEKLQQFWGSGGCGGVERGGSVVCVTLVWRQAGDSPVALLPTLSVSPLAASQVSGEHNLGRFLARLCDVVGDGKNSSLYEGPAGNQVITARVDEMLDLCHTKFTLGSNKDRAAFLREVNVKLGTEIYLAGSNLSVADLMLLSGLVQLRMLESSPPNVQAWGKRCLAHQLCKNFI